MIVTPLSIMEEVAESLHETTELPVGESTSRRGSLLDMS